MTPDQIIREEFERWASEGGRLSCVLTRHAAHPERHRLPTLNVQWQAWKAAWTVAEGYRA